LLIIAALISIAFAVIIGIGFVMGSIIGLFSCSAQWSRSGYDYSYGPVKGCVVHINGRWIPADNVREIDKP